ncbi:hypothetical protein [Blastococcus mobilis]|uniref:hypothetical protein n=1 Tax=Blastococcus mobilis TaxID=1938746 RepID=UPI003F620C15
MFTFELIYFVTTSGAPRGFGHQEAAQADGEEEAPQAAEEDARSATQQEVS